MSNYMSFTNLPPFSAGSLSRPGSRAGSPVPNPGGIAGGLPAPTGFPPAQQPTAAAPTTAYQTTQTLPGQASAATFGPSYYASQRPNTYVAPAPPTTTMTTAAYGGYNNYSAPVSNESTEKWRQMANNERAKVTELEEEEKRMQAEEAMLRQRQQEIATEREQLSQLESRVNDGWAAMYRAAESERIEQADRYRDPSLDEEFVLRQRLQAAEQRVAQAKQRHSQLEMHLNHANGEVAKFASVEAKRKEQEDQLKELTSAFELIESKRRALEVKCRKYTELEVQRDRVVTEHLSRINADALKDGETSVPTTAQILVSSGVAVTSNPAATAPVTNNNQLLSHQVMAELEGDEVPLPEDLDLLGGAGIMDSVCVSVNTGAKRRRLESEHGGSQAASSRGVSLVS